MKKCVIRIMICLLLTVSVWVGKLLSDGHRLAPRVRQYIAAEAVSTETLVHSIQAELRNLTDAEAARTYIRQNMPVLRYAVDEALEQVECQAYMHNVILARLQKYGIRIPERVPEWENIFFLD